MAKKTWVKPMTLVQKFEANESVAATQCYRVACDVSNDETWENSLGAFDLGWEYFNFKVEHGANGCKNINNQYIQVTNGTVQMMENSAVARSCVFYTDDKYGTQTSNPILAAGEYVYWTTSKQVGGRFVWSDDKTATWHHKGEIQLAAPNHPNQS